MTYPVQRRQFVSQKLWLALAVAAGLMMLAVGSAPASEQAEFRVGAARVDVTPDHPVLLNGYLARKNLPPAREIDTPIYVRALAVTDATGDTVVLVTIDTCAIPEWFRRKLERVVEQDLAIDPAHLALSCTHTHYAPILRGAIPFIFGSDIPPEEQARIDRYTERVLSACVTAVKQALATRRDARLARQVGTVGFAANRRTPGGPVDHSLPVLWARDARTDYPIAILTTYACHATTIPPQENRIHGDWPGVAAMELEARFPGAVALVTIGCGADANPHPRGSAELARRYGRQIADEVSRLAAERPRSIRGPVRASFDWIELPLERIPDPTGWQKRAQSKHEPTAYHARHFLRLLEQGKTIPSTVSYPVQTWCFGNDLAMVFLGGEVVVDYAIRLRRECDSDRIWIHAYSNTVPCYIASRRVLAEGGYEAEGSMIYYGQPGRLNPEVEDLIVDTVLRLLPHEFYSEQQQQEFPPPLLPEESRGAIRVPPGLTVELVASEPEVVDPVAIDFGADGRVWVVEYRDYPTGLPRDYRPGGRIKWLRDRDRDGRYEEVRVFADRVPFPTGIMEWGDGVLVGSAPDVLWFRDTDGDGVADRRVVLFTGFYTDNYQARVNGFTLGLDGWIYGSCGLFGGDIVVPGQGKPVPLRQRDFRFRIDPPVLEPAGGRSQYGRVRDDYGHWFGNTNSQLLLFYPLEDHYLRRVDLRYAPTLSVYAPDGNYDSARLFPISRTLTRFNNPEHYNRVTSACGPAVYRDNLLGAEYYGNAFICEPVHNLVTRLVLRQDGVLIRGRRAEGETEAEFLASRDNWFRPVQVATGPDGGLWVVDMYRFVIEHPRWISPRRLRRLNVRAGDNAGRIYRVRPGNNQLRPVPDLTRLSPQQLAALVDSPNGTLRDLVHRLFMTTCEVTPEAQTTLRQLAGGADSDQVRLQALCILGGTGHLSGDLVKMLLRDPSPHVRRWAVRLAERWLESDDALLGSVSTMARDADPEVRLQVALSLGQTPASLAAAALQYIAQRDGADPYFACALLSSMKHHWYRVAEAFVREKPAPEPFWSAFWEQTGRSAEPADLCDLLSGLARRAAAADTRGGEYLSASAALLAAARKRFPADRLLTVCPVQSELSALAETSRAVLRGTSQSSAAARAAVKVLREAVAWGAEELEVLSDLLTPDRPPEMQEFVLDALLEAAPVRAAEYLLSQWTKLAPTMQRAAIERLLQQRDTTNLLLQSVRAGRLPTSDLTPSQKQRLMDHPDPAIAQASRELFSAAAASEEVVEAKIRSLSRLKGDPARGASLFEKHCAVCHEAEQGGQRPGPDLSELTDTSVENLARSILAPNAAVDDRYLSYLFATVRGQVFTGIVLEETPSTIVLALPDGTLTRLAKAEIETVRNTGRSLMPDGFLEELSDKDLADLVAYIQEHVFQRKTLSAREDGSYLLLPSNAVVAGGAARIVTHRQVVTLGQWQPGKGTVRWQVEVAREGDYAVIVDWMNEANENGTFLIRCRSEGKEGALRWEAYRTEVAREGNWYRAESIGRLHLPPGRAVLELEPLGPRPFPPVYVRSLLLRPL